MSEHISGRRCRAWAAVIVFALIFVWMAIPASAQESGAILGTVKDTSGGVVASAKVTATNTDTNETRTVNTGDDGAYRIHRYSSNERYRTWSSRVNT